MLSVELELIVKLGTEIDEIIFVDKETKTHSKEKVVCELYVNFASVLMLFNNSSSSDFESIYKSNCKPLILIS